MTKITFHYHIARVFMNAGYSMEAACAEARQALRDCPTPEARQALIEELRSEA